MSRIINGSPAGFPQRFDLDGNVVNASDGGVILVDGVYHWYGLRLRPLPFGKNGSGGQVTDVGVVMYASRDLHTWQYEGVILACDKDPGSPLYGPMRFERPKILYNALTRKFVLWCHYVAFPGDHGFTPGSAEAGIAVCDTVNGSYRFLGTTRPIDDKGYVRDCTLFQDTDGSAYFIYDRQISDAFNPVLQPFERCLHIVKLSDDYTSCTNQWARIDAADAREAPCVFKRGELYYMITSGLTGWEHNPAKYFVSDHPKRGWRPMSDPFTGDQNGTAFNTQGSYVFKTAQGEYIYMCERHNTDNFELCSPIWLPIQFEADGRITLNYQHSVEITA